MSFLGSIFGYLIMAVVVGAIIGWLIWGGEPFEATSSVGGGGDDERSVELAAQVEAREQEIARLRKRLKRVHTDLDTRDGHVAAAKTAQQEVSELLFQRESELEMLREQHEQVVSQGLLAAEFQDGSGAVSDPMLLRRVAELEEDLAMSRSDAAQVRQSATLISEERDEAMRQLALVADSQEAAREEAGQRSVGADNAEREFASQVAQLEADLDETRLERDAADQRAAELQLAYEQLSVELAETQGGQDEASAQVAATSREFDDLGRRLRIAEAALTERDASLSALHEQVSALESAPPQPDEGLRVDELRLELTKVQTELSRSRQSVATLRQRVEEVEDENDRLAGDLARATTDLSSKSSRSADAAAENERLATELTRLRTGVLGLDERAKKAENEAQRLQGELTSAQQNLLAGRSESESTMSALHVELSDARLRADVAHEALQELTQDFVTFREATNRQQTSMQALSDRLDLARASLIGRKSIIQKSSDDADGVPVDNLHDLPNISPLLVANLNEFGVMTFAEIGGWSSNDISRIESMLGEPLGSIQARGWVEAAQRLTSSDAGNFRD